MLVKTKTLAYLVLLDESPHVLDLDGLVLRLELGHVLLQLDDTHRGQLRVLRRFTFVLCMIRQHGRKVCTLYQSTPI